jgi:hypothetical protein
MRTRNHSLFCITASNYTERPCASVGNAQQNIIGGFRFDPSPPSPTSVSWQLAKPNGEHVEIAFEDIHSNPGGFQVGEFKLQMQQMKCRNFQAIFDR